MQEEKAGCLIDLHCGNNLPGTPADPNAYGRVQPALQFMHLFPYIDSLWFGEGYDYDQPPEYWLVEVSGLAFGLMGDMMHAGNPWRGMLYGMTTRFRCADPQPIWRVWDAFQIDKAVMIGFWEADEKRPVTLGCAAATTTANTTLDDGAVLATSYVRRGDATLVAIASWANTTASCRLHVDYAALGLEARSVRLTRPHIEGFQDAHVHAHAHAADPAVGSHSVDIDAGRGFLLLLEHNATRTLGAAYETEASATALVARDLAALRAALVPSPRGRGGATEMAMRTKIPQSMR